VRISRLESAFDDVAAKQRGLHRGLLKGCSEGRVGRENYRLKRDRHNPSLLRPPTNAPKHVLAFSNRRPMGFLR
jgi:hypothetical protein